MEKYLDRIKKLIKKGNCQTPGLFSGYMGICFSLYVINKGLKDIEIERIADNLLEKTLNEIYTMKDVSFDKGLAGIGCAINLLHMNNCIEGDIDDILYNFDATIYKNLNEQNRHHSVDLLNGLIGYLLYIVSRFKNESHKKDTFQNTINESILRIIIDKLEIKMPDRFYLSSRDILTTILWDTPILFYCLGEVIKMGIYKEKIERMVEDWSYVLVGSLPFFDINRLALANSLTFVNKDLGNKNIESYVDTLYYSIKFQNYLREINKNSISINGDWFYAMFNVHMARKLMDKKHVRYLEMKECASKLFLLYEDNIQNKFLNSIEEKDNISLINGLSGALLVYSISKKFSILKNNDE